MDAAATAPAPSPKLPRFLLMAGVILPLLLFALPFVLAQFYPQPPPELVLDMLVTKGTITDTDEIRVWVNDPAGEFLQQYSSPAQRRTYRFKLCCQRLRYLQIMAVNGQDVELHEVRIEHSGKTIKRFGPDDLLKWQSNCQGAAVSKDALRVHSPPNGHPVLFAGFRPVTVWELGTNPLTHLAFWMYHDQTWPQKVRVLACLLVAVFVAGLWNVTRLGRTVLQTVRTVCKTVLPFLVFAISLPITAGSVLLVRALDTRPPPADRALGYTCYVGYPASLHLLQVALLVCVPALVAALVGWINHRRFSQSAPAGRTELIPFYELPPVPWKGRAGIALMAFLTLVLACYFIPDLVGVQASFTSSSVLQWDKSNNLVWAHLIQTGSVPFRDFWYPYSGMALFHLAFPYGELCQALHTFLVFTVFLWGVYVNTRRSIAVTLCIFMTVFGLVTGGFTHHRYLLIVNPILAYAALDQEARKLGWRHALLWLALAHAGVMEPVSVMYAGIPILVSWGLDVWAASGLFWRRLPARLAREFVVPAAILSAVAVLLASQGQLTGLLEFMGSLGALANYCGFPVDLPGWLRHPFLPESFVLWAVVFLTAAAVAGLRDRSEANRRIARIVLLLALATDMLLLKQFVRPGSMAIHIIAIPITAILLYLACWDRFNQWQKGLVFLGAGALCAMVFTTSHTQKILATVCQAPGRALSSVPFLAMGKLERSELVARRFAPSRFQLSTGHQAVVAALTELFHSEGAQPIVVLSDDPIFYVLAGASPYYHTNSYNASPIEEQQRMVRLLEATPPRLVIWRPTDPGMDCVPPAVRVPLLYDHVIRNYVPHATLEQYELLRPRRPGEPVAIDFWRARLGDVVHLGHLPRFSSIARFGEPADAMVEGSAEFLSVKITDAAAVAGAPPPDVPALPMLGGYRPAGKALAIPVECAGRRFTIALQVVPGQSEYHVFLERVWFWGPLRRAGFSPVVENVGPGVQARVLRRAMAQNILY